MTSSRTDIIEIARSRERQEDLPTIDLSLLEKAETENLLIGSSTSHRSNLREKNSHFRTTNLRKKHILFAVVLILMLLVSSAYAERILRGDSIANGVTVDGINVGGKNESTAKKILEDKSKIATNTPMLFSVDNKEVSVSSQDLALNYDSKATVIKAQSIDSSFNPVEIIPGFVIRYTTGKNIAPVSSFDKVKFKAVVENLVNSLSEGRADASITITGTEVLVTPAKSGKGVSELQATQALNTVIDGFSREKNILKSEKVDAQISLQEAENTAKTLRTMFSEDTLMSTPGGNSFTVTPSVLASSINVSPKGKSLIIGIDSAKIRGALADQLGKVEQVPVDASFSVNDSGVNIIPSVVGKRVDFNAALSSWMRGSHKFEAKIVEVEPKRNTAWAQSLNITEMVSSFSTNFTPGQTRVKNIARAVEQVNNIVVEPGQTFSLNETLGKRTAENGYFKAPVYSDADGFFEDFGGGASQFSTTLFNAAFIGGYKDVTHAPHSIYIARYPMGREATLNWGSIDMAFKNDSNSGILIRTGIGSTSVSVTLYGNKEGRTVKLEGPIEMGRIPIATEYTDDPALPVGTERQVQGGFPGIVVENFRTVTRQGKEGRRERYRWTYDMVPRKVARGTKPAA